MNRKHLASPKLQESQRFEKIDRALNHFLRSRSKTHAWAVSKGFREKNGREKQLPNWGLYNGHLGFVFWAAMFADIEARNSKKEI